MTAAPVLVSRDARGVVQVVLNRPEVSNAYDSAMIDGLLAACASARAGARAGVCSEAGASAEAGVPGAAAEGGAVRVVVLSGRGRHFQAGADLGWLNAVRPQGDAANLDASERTARAVWELNTLPVPTVALIQGACFGGGTGIAAACDVVIAADNAQFAISETRWGMSPFIILPQLADAIGVRHLRRYALTGERFDAAEAKRIGLVHEVVPLEELAAAGEKVVDALLRNAPGANAATKAATLRHAWVDGLQPNFSDIVAAHAAGRQSTEAAEGMASFEQKRDATWYRKA